jgi:hypothetical protein
VLESDTDRVLKNMLLARLFKNNKMRGVYGNAPNDEVLQRNAAGKCFSTPADIDRIMNLTCHLQEK